VAFFSADIITTVSPTYAKEILNPEYGFGLDGVLRKRQGSLRGIINGVDYKYGILKKIHSSLNNTAYKI